MFIKAVFVQPCFTIARWGGKMLTNNVTVQVSVWLLRITFDWLLQDLPLLIINILELKLTLIVIISTVRTIH